MLMNKTKNKLNSLKIEIIGVSTTNTVYSYKYSVFAHFVSLFDRVSFYPVICHSAHM
jgi:hypothetical protein